MSYPFAAPAQSRGRNYTGVGISRDGSLYVYAKTPDEPGDVIDSIIGCPNRLELREMATKSEYGQRTYLLLFLDSPSGDEAGNVVLRVPIGYKRGDTGAFQLSGPTRSLLAALEQYDPGWHAIQVFSTRGTKANFLDVIPLNDKLEPGEQVRSRLIAPTREAAEEVVARFNAQLRERQTAHA